MLNSHETTGLDRNTILNNGENQRSATATALLTDIDRHPIPDYGHYASLGFGVFPIKTGTKNTSFDDWPNLALYGANTATIYWYSGHFPYFAQKYRNVGLALDGLVVVDVDVNHGDGKDGFKSKAEMEADYGELPQTRAHKSPRGGVQYIYLADPDRPMKSRPLHEAKYPGIDIKASRGARILCPGSVTEHGVYSVESDHEIAPMPEWLYDVQEASKPTNRYGVSATAAPHRSPEDTPEGIAILDQKCAELADCESNRNNLLNNTAMYLGHLVHEGKLTEQTVVDSLRHACRSAEDGGNGLVNEDGLSGVDKTIRSGFSKGVQAPRSKPVETRPAQSIVDVVVPPATSPTEQPARPHVVQGYQLTQLGNAERLRDRHGRSMHHVPGWGWLTWDGRCWKTNAAPQARRYMQSVVKEAEAWLIAQDEAIRSKYDSWFTDMSKAAGISAALTEASVFLGIDAEVSDFDADPYKLLVGNGVVNLRTGQLSEYHRDDRITKGTTVDYDPDAGHPRWTDFLNWAFKGDDQMIDYVQRMFGMCLVGNNSHQVAFFLYGPGRSGKTTLVNILSRLLGDYATVADLSVFRESAGGHNDALARLAGRRLVTFSETRAGQQINEAVFKRMTGGDELTASFKGKTGFSFKPMFTPVMFGNAQPSILFDSGVARRMKVIPMTASISDAEKDLELENKLMSEEGPAILAWAVRGAMASCDSDPADPPTVAKAIQDLRQDSDPLTQYIEDRLIVDESTKDSKVKSGDVWADYRDWVQSGGVDFVGNSGQGGLTSRLKTWGAEHGYRIDSHRTGAGGRSVRGVRLANPGSMNLH